MNALAQTPKSLGRPFACTREVIDDICDRLSRGQSLIDICEDPKLPNEDTVYRHLQRDEYFRGEYARARENQAHRKFEEAERIARNATPETAQVARLQVDVIKWQTAKMAPKVYGERTQIEHSGEIIVEEKTTLALGDLSDDAREEARELIDRMRMLHARNVTPANSEETT